MIDQGIDRHSTHSRAWWGSVTLSLCCVAEVTNLVAIAWRLAWTIFQADLSLLDLSIPVQRTFAVRATGLPAEKGEKPLDFFAALVPITKRLLCLFEDGGMRTVKQPRAQATRDRILSEAGRL